MRLCGFVALLFVVLGLPVRAADIAEVLAQSQQRRVQELAPLQAAADSERAGVVRTTFARLLDALGADLPVAVIVVGGPVVAEALTDHIVAVNETLADMPEGERLFVIAHELCHVAHDHWSQRTLLYRRHVPGEVVQERTDAVAATLGREASALAHEQELEADAFAMRALKRLGYGFETALAVFMRQGVQHDTATHPGTRKRVAHLRAQP